ncbi:hypothetical protein, partial [Klebsiella quasipneumoniae]|uniref:hypothetical protein n=1 Tax=Klebsiella quasipneumoniae TaxID=1463165 RepID=UPI001084019C
MSKPPMLRRQTASGASEEIVYCYYKGFPGMSTPVFMVSVCSSVKIKGRDCGTINGHDESSSI